MRVTIVGLGLLGGSFALRLRELEPEAEVTAIDVPETFQHEKAREAAQRFVPVGDEAGFDAAIERADLTLLAVPVQRIVALLPRVLERAALVTDCGSTKRAIVRAVSASPRRGRFVPGHPMAGAPEGCIEHATADLFATKRRLLCPEGADPDALEMVEGLVRRLG